MSQFVERNGELFKVLVLEGPGAWLISHDSPASPFFVGDMDAYQHTLPPSAQGGELSAAGQKRLELIQPLLDAGDAAVMDKQYRLNVAKDIAERYSTTHRTVLKLFYRYLATGQLLSPKARAPSTNPDFDWAIRTFYFSAKKLSLRSAYEMMLLQRYTDFEGNLAPIHPSFGSFRAYFYSRNYHKSPRKIIARDLRLIIVGSIIMDCRNGSPDPMTEAFLQIAGVFSQLELSMIRARVKSGMANAKAKGKRIGRPPVSAESIPNAFLRYYPRYQAGNISLSELARLAQVSRPTAYRYIRALTT